MVAATLLPFPRMALVPHLQQARLAEPLGGARCARSRAECDAQRSGNSRIDVAEGMPPRLPAASPSAQSLGPFRLGHEPELTLRREHGEHAGPVS